MKPLSIFYMILFAGILAVSCTTTRPINDDNVYMMKTSALPVGENLTDETSYATYKHRKETDNPTAGYYDPLAQSALQRDPRANNNSLFYMGLYQGNYNGLWGMHRNGAYFGPGLPGATGVWAFLFFNSYPTSYGMYGNNGWNNYYNGGINNYYGIYGNNGSNVCYFNNLYSFGNSGNTYISRPNANYVSGPRGTTSGYYSGNNRGGAAQLKSQVSNTDSYARPGARETNVPSQSAISYRRDNGTGGGASTIGRTSYTRTATQARVIDSRTYEESRRATTINTSSSPSRITLGSGSTNTRSNSSGSASGSSRGGSSGSGSSSGSSGSRSGGRGN